MSSAYVDKRPKPSIDWLGTRITPTNGVLALVFGWAILGFALMIAILVTKQAWLLGAIALYLVLSIIGWLKLPRRKVGRHVK